MKSRQFASLGRALAIFRELRAHSQAELARRSKTGKSQISKYESGRELPTLSSLERLLDTLEVPQDLFFSVVAMLDRLRDRLSTPSETLPSLIAMVPSGRSFSSLDSAFEAAFKSLFHLHRAALETLVARILDPEP